MLNLEHVVTDLQVAYDQQVGEPLDEITREAVAARMSVILKSHNIRKGCVVCDATNNPPSVIAAHDLVADVWIELDDGRVFNKTFNKGNSEVAKGFAPLFGKGV
jgi:hypothetical protein